MIRRTSIYKTFRVYLNCAGHHHGRFYKVDVFKTREAMFDYCRSIGQSVSARGFEARNFKFFAPYRGKHGMVLFFRGGTHPETVAHEMLHVALTKTPKSRRRVFTNRSDQERVCRLQDSLIWQFYSCYR